MTTGQCDGTVDAPYPGSGTNKHCAFKDVRFFWQDGTYANGTSFPAYGWIGHGGDTYLIRGSIAAGVSYRIGWNNGNNSLDAPTHQYWGLAGDAYSSGMPAPLSGTLAQHTRILGENYAACRHPEARVQLHGGYGVFAVINMQGVSYVDVACFDITDFSNCGRSGQTNICHSDIPLSDYALNGIEWSNTATHDTLTDIRIHGTGSAGMLGPTGDGMVFTYLDLIGNPSSGWNADSGNGQTGSGSLLVQHYNIGWNGCAEEYPIVDAEPYQNCTDDESLGYGDGFGTATVDSNPAWNVTFDQGEVFNNTQDGLDALHIDGAGSSMTVSHTLAYGNMGQQIKVGGASGVITDNRIVTNCNALRQAIPGTPTGYNAKLSDFCRAADGGVLVNVNDKIPLKFDFNTIYSASTVAVEIECAANPCAGSKVDFRNNIFIGFPNIRETGYAAGGSGDYSTPIYIGSPTNPFKNPASLYSNNTTYHPRKDWKCPAAGETRQFCGDPHLIDETWHLYGYGNMAPIAGSRDRNGELTSQSAGNQAGSPRPGRIAVHTFECICAGALAFATWQGIRQWQGR